MANEWIKSPLLGAIIVAFVGYLITEVIPYDKIELAFRLPIGMTLRLLLGIVVGLIYPKHWVGVSLFSVVATVGAVLVDSMTREINLLPIALIFHVVLVFPVLIGAFIGKMLVSRQQKKGLEL